MSETMSNKDRVNKVFEILGVEPNEIFRIRGTHNCKPEYYFDNDLELHCVLLGNDSKLDSEKSNKILVNLLRGYFIMQKVIVPTKEEQIAIDYALACGYHWLAKDKDGSIYAYKEKPQKTGYDYMWNDNDKGALEIGLPISFLSWEDDEPYYIGD